MIIYGLDLLKLAGIGVASVLAQGSGIYNLDRDWRPTKADISEWLADPLFFTLNGIVTNQSSVSEYEGDEYLYGFRKNCCGFAAIASATKLFHYLKFGDNPYVKIKDVVEDLNLKLFIDAYGNLARIHTTEYRMYFSRTTYAINKYLALGQLVTAKLLTQNPSSTEEESMTRPSEWPAIFSEAEEICAKGGALLVYGKRTGSGHLVLCTDFSSDGCVVIDSAYPDSFRTTSLTNWLKLKVDHDEPQPFGVIGLIPKTDVERLEIK